VPVQGTRINASRRSARAARVPPIADRVQVERKSGRICVTITRRHPRLFCLSDAEARYLSILLGAEAGSGT
jgi:hypothetical protein